MKQLLILAFIFGIGTKIAAQQNWAAVPCFSVQRSDYIGRMLNNDAQNELILLSAWSYEMCNTTYKGLVAYNGSTFHDMDLGLETHDPNPYLGSIVLTDCAEFNAKAVIIGGFSSVGRDTLWSKNIATWNGTKWDTVPHPLYNSLPTSTYSAGFSKLLNDNGKLWMFGGYDSSGYFKQRPFLYDGLTFTPVPRIPVTNQSAITEAIMYKNKLVVVGNFENWPSLDFNRLAQFDGTSWSSLGTGIHGGLSAVQSVAVYNDTLYIGGAFPKSPTGNAGNYLMKWDGTQLRDAGFSNVFCGYGAIWKLLPYRNRLYAFGGFSCVAGKKAFGVAYYENGKWTVPKDSIDNNNISDAAVYNDAIYIGGGFRSINGDTTIQKFAKLTCPDFDAASGCISGVYENSKVLDVRIFPNPSTDKIHIEFERSTNIDKIRMLNTLGQVVQETVNPAPNCEIDISGLGVGIYFLQAQNKHNMSVFKIIKE